MLRRTNIRGRIHSAVFSADDNHHWVDWDQGGGAETDSLWCEGHADHRITGPASGTLAGNLFRAGTADRTVCGSEAADSMRQSA
jgi:hypothetical protein